MRRAASWAPLAPLALVALGGCGSAEKAPAPAREAAPPEATGEETAPADPWARVAGGPAGQPAPAAAVRFHEPADPRPSARERRPALPAPAVLGLAVVRDGYLAGEADTLLQLSAELSRVEGLGDVIGLGGAPDPPGVDLAGLARLAAAGERDLLLVDVRPSRRAGGARDGYLVHAASGALLACWTIDAREEPVVPTGDEPDLVAQIAAAHGRLQDGRLQDGRLQDGE